ncbi:MAG: acyl-CoA thioesterase [Proteobacteria bacterium]|nr:acyl-CoA thioesterase [Pseudomonadota bacterium]
MAEERDKTGGKPRGALAIRTVAMPADANANGDIFGGWVLGQMDIAGGIVASERCRGRCATVAVDAMTFHLPVYVGDVLAAYAEVVKVGRSSMTIRVEAWAKRRMSGEQVKVTEGTFTYVAIDENRHPRPVDSDRVEV